MVALDQLDELTLGVTIALDVPFGGREGAVACKLLHIAQRSSDFRQRACSARNKGPPQYGLICLKLRCR